MSGQISILIIYTGGTIGMVKDPETGSLLPVDFAQISSQVPELKRFGYQLKAITYDPPIDSSNMSPEIWVGLAGLIEEYYRSYDGFVILHGTDTMAYSASALSFIMENLDKPVIFTGSQLPIGTLRTDGKENLITAIEIAAARENGLPLVPEVCIYFENALFRGNRTHKNNAENFNAFTSDNYPVLAEAGVTIRYNHDRIRRPAENASLKVQRQFSAEIAILKIFPGISAPVVEHILAIPTVKAVILETFGSGNAPNVPWFLQALKKAVDRGLVIMNVTQCDAGSVEMDRYETGVELGRLGVVSGYDSTTEAAVTKLMYLFGKYGDPDLVKKFLNISLVGEITV
ncbi:MAG: type I asparaginase [Bacteroidales bacterium]